jgi:hypothetical protein
MAKTLAQRVAATLAANEKARGAAEYKAGEPARRSMAARVAADTRKEHGIERAIRTGIARNKQEQRALDYMEGGY